MRVGEAERWKNPVEPEEKLEVDEAKADAAAAAAAESDPEEQNLPDGDVDLWKALVTGRTGPLDLALEDVVIVVALGREKAQEKRF